MARSLNRLEAESEREDGGGEKATWTVSDGDG